MLSTASRSPMNDSIRKLPIELLRVNHAFRGIAVPTGACRVRFDYSTPRLRLGLSLSILAAVVLLALGLRSWRSSAR